MLLGCCKSAGVKDSSSTEQYTLVLIRNGESTLDKGKVFSGWTDCALSERGVEEAKAAGKSLKEAGFTFDVAYTSVLKSAIKTMLSILEELDIMYIPMYKSWRLNERHYGSLEGMSTQEASEKHGPKKLMIWQTSYRISPPKLDESSERYPGHDPRYEEVETEDLPYSESLELLGYRLIPYWKRTLVPEIKSGKKILISSHGDTIRALVRHLDGISKKDICKINIPKGVPLIYTLDAKMKPIPHADAIAPLKGRYLGDLEKIKAQRNAINSQTGLIS